MAYLSNKSVNYLNIHGALLGLLEQAFGLFAPIYLYVKGFSLIEVFLLLALFNAARIPLRLLSFPVVGRFGLKFALMFGTAGFAFTFPILTMVKGYDLWLLLYVILFGTFSAMYWHCFHTFYTLAGDLENRGKQISVAMGMTAAVSAISPLLSAFFITDKGYETFFLLPIPLLCVMLFLLSKIDDIPVKHSAWSEGKKLIFNLGARIHVAEATAVFSMNIGWILLIYLYFDEVISLGGVVTIGIIFQIIYQLWIGKMVDNDKGHLVSDIAGALRILQVIVKSFIPISPSGIITGEISQSIASVHHNISQPTAMYNAGKNTSHTFWYWLFAETAFDIGTIIGCSAIALLLYLGTPLQYTILVAIPGVLYVWYLTRTYYKG